jgi:ketosteroid isomerase-like protein
MSDRNVDTVRRALDAFNRADVETLMEDCAEDFLFLPARSALDGGYRGEAGLRRYFEDNAETFEVFTVRLDEVHAAGDRVVAIGSIRLRPLGGGPEADIPTAVVYTFRAGKAIRGEDFREREVALRAADLDA